ncbi:MAG: DUF4142 domain-containing protein [Flavitalea sp.]
MKKLSLAAIIGLSVFALQSCNDHSSDPVKSANETNDVMLDSARHDSIGTASTPVSEDDSKFAVKAASGGMMEVQLGELAQQKAYSRRVKDFGAMMVRDHTKGNDELKSLAGMKSITLPPAPGEDHMDHIKNLSKKSGKEFDKDYMKMMVDDHKEDIDDFKKEATDGKDSDVKGFAGKILPVLVTHLDSAKAVLSSLK